MKVLVSKTNMMQEKSVRQKKRQNSGMLRGLGCFLGRKWAVAVPIFTLFNFSFFLFPSSDLFLCQITSTKYAQTEKKRPLKKKVKKKM